MLYRAVKDCTDFDGRRYSAGDEAELSVHDRHSAYLVAEVPAATIEPASVPVAEPMKKTARKKK